MKPTEKHKEALSSIASTIHSFFEELAQISHIQCRADLVTCDIGGDIGYIRIITGSFCFQSMHVYMITPTEDGFMFGASHGAIKYKIPTDTIEDIDQWKRMDDTDAVAPNSPNFRQDAISLLREDAGKIMDTFDDAAAFVRKYPRNHPILTLVHS